MARRHTRRLVLTVFVAVICGGVLAVADRAEGVQFLPGVQVGTVQNGELDEASGIAASRQNANVLWAHNDSGDTARVFAMNVQGTHLGIYNLSGAGAVDWEDMAIGPGPTPGLSYLYLGDIGDNYGQYSSIRVFRVPEPVVSSTQAPVVTTLTGVETITLRYPGGTGRDAETLMVDPLTKDIYVVSKRESKSRLYRAAYPQSTGAPITMDYVAELSWNMATGGDISADGDEILIRGYHNASLWSRPLGGSIAAAIGGPSTSVSLVSEPQGEAICFDAAGLGYYTTSEYPNQPIYYFARVPEPGVLTLLGSGMIALLFCRYRKWNILP